MSKTRLAALLGEHGIAYEHRRALGTPPDLRFLFRAGRLAEAAEGYRRHVEAHASDELDALAAELRRRRRTALLCLEADPAHCHRRVVAEALGAPPRRPGGHRPVARPPASVATRRSKDVVEVDRDPEAAGRLERHEAVDGAAERARRVDRVVALEAPAAQHGEETSTRLLRGRPVLGVARAPARPRWPRRGPGGRAA